MVAQTKPPNQRAPTPARTHPFFVSFPPTTALAFTQPKLRQATKSPDRNRLGPKELAPRGHELFRSTRESQRDSREAANAPYAPFVPSSCRLRVFVFQKSNSANVNPQNSKPNQSTKQQKNTHALGLIPDTLFPTPLLHITPIAHALSCYGPKK